MSVNRFTNTRAVCNEDLRRGSGRRCVARGNRRQTRERGLYGCNASRCIKFTHNAGKAGKKWLPETMGSGCAFFDADGDGWPDILLINGKDWTPRAGRKSHAALYRNNHNGTFTDITSGSGLDIEI